MIEEKNDWRPNYQSPSYFIVANKLQCLNCCATTSVWAFALPQGIMPFFISRISKNAIEQMHWFTHSYHLGEDQRNGEIYWMNHCSECQIQMDEIDIFEESKTGAGPFGAYPFEGTERLQVQEFKQPFQAWAGDDLNFWLLTKKR